MDIKALNDGLFGHIITVQGWVRTARSSGAIAFIELNDGSTFSSLQLVLQPSLADFNTLSHLPAGTAISATGALLSGQGSQKYDLAVEEITVLGKCDPDYPLQKKRHSFEFLREIAHLRPRANTFRAVFRVRSVLAQAIHNHYQGAGYLYLNSPLITANDAEGAGDTFAVQVNGEDFFTSPAMLSVTGQLQAEAFALAFGKVYTFGPTFRADKSNTPRHANEFWMIEPETAFTDLDANIANIEACIKAVVRETVTKCPEELAFLNQHIDQGLLARLDQIINQPFARLTYRQAIEILQKAVADGVPFANSHITFGIDLQSDHERYLCEKVAKGPLFLTDYPKEIKAFYMRLNDDQETVAAVDLLVPGIGELVGGSQREERLDLLKEKMQESGIEEAKLSWYTDLRRFGGVVHAGYGIGFERLVMLVTGIDNIRDVLPFPRTPGGLKY